MRTFIDDYLIERNFVFNPDQVLVTEETIKGSIVHCYETLDMIETLEAKLFVPAHADASEDVGRLHRSEAFGGRGGCVEAHD